ncbi:receptor-type tyrosine-protein phosphatase U-like [Amphiura filiformis]|uniref:receptor-type tyrosine-protein phosphatase U-like n=1 Tax=Amphiura filiformis TaxID=82378 RepID=UPI003B222AFB
MLTATCSFRYFRTGIICPSMSDISISSSLIMFSRPAITFPALVSDIVYTNSANGMEIATLPFTQSPHILTGLETGMWVVRATATDADGNAASCQFSFMVGSTAIPPTSVVWGNEPTTSTSEAQVTADKATIPPTSVVWGNEPTTSTSEAQVTADKAISSAPSGLRATGLGKTSIALEWSKPQNPNGIILDYAIKYQAREKAYDPDFISDNRYTTLTIPATASDDAHEYLVDDLEPSTKYEFRVSGRTSVGRGEEAVIEVYTKTFTDIDPLEPPVLKKLGASIIIEFDFLPTYISNVLIAVEYATSRNKRQNSNLDGASNSFIVANLTRSDIEEEMAFTLGDNKTYGGYINNVLIAGATYTVRVAYASCTPVEECVVAWSPVSVITAPDCTIERCGEPEKVTNIGATIGGSLVAITAIVIIIIVAIVIYCRRQHSPSQKSPTSNETYDEIDPQIAIAQQSTIQKTTGYEVNLAMEGIQTPNQYEGDELDYEDVNIKRDSDYQGLNTGVMETEHDYQGLGETEKKKESNYQVLNKANMDEEHAYQGLGQNGDTNRKTSSPYVNVP